MDAEIAWFCELLAPLGAVRARRMFGGWGLYLDGRMVALVADGELYLKARAEDHAALSAAGSVPFVYRSATREVTMSYWRAPVEALDDPEAMRPWARRALAAARAAAAPKGRRRGGLP
jgi:DNA transformation protein and related proteins